MNDHTNTNPPAWIDARIGHVLPYRTDPRVVATWESRGGASWVVVLHTATGYEMLAAGSAGPVTDGRTAEPTTDAEAIACMEAPTAWDAGKRRVDINQPDANRTPMRRTYTAPAPTCPRCDGMGCDTCTPKVDPACDDTHDRDAGGCHDCGYAVAEDPTPVTFAVEWRDADNPGDAFGEVDGSPFDDGTAVLECLHTDADTVDMCGGLDDIDGWDAYVAGQGDAVAYADAVHVTGQRIRYRITRTTGTADADPVTFTDGDGVIWDMAYATCGTCSHALRLEDRAPYGSMGRLFVCPGCGMRSDEPTFDPAEVAFLGTVDDDGEDDTPDPAPAVDPDMPKGYTAYGDGPTCGGCGYTGYGPKVTGCGWCSESAATLLDLDDVARGYMVAAAWADAVPHGMGDDGETGGLQGETFTAEAMASARVHVARFIAANVADAQAYVSARTFDPAEGTVGDYFGHDLRLTEGGHGVGFWDRGMGELGERLTAAVANYAPDCWQQADGTLAFDMFPHEQARAAQVSA